ncbi:hypothetical protein SAMN04487914_108119 [Arthrobacter sp. ok909]|uniref:hypothetical protein n=1 Tax=Arthrobacter sp. ok909 TaxID=1761746 RepID=UPI00088F153D|nr:hypothetical protein [Arthrobacter sp. ok909]SDP33790.1 hypothetical protein SAMN04487914_108119 [Arthrobacter sp. ok909]
MGMYDEGAKRVSNSKFVEFEPGKKVRLRLLDHPNVSHKQYKPNEDISTQFAWPVWNYTLGKQQILQKGPGVFKRIASIIEDYSDQMPMSCDLSITTSGSGLQTRYEITPVPVAGTMPVIKSDEIIDIDKELPNSIPLLRFAEGADPEVETAGEFAPITQRDQLPTGDDVEKINIDDIPF